jgi:hypothetical protein
MTKKIGTVLVGNAVTLIAAGVLAFAPVAKAQSSFAEMSISAAHGLYAEGRMPKAQSFGMPGVFASVYPASEAVIASYSSSSSPVSFSTDEMGTGYSAGGGDKVYSGVSRPIPAYTPSMTPFKTYALAVKVGSMGIGLDVATPLAQRLNLRVGASFFQYNTTLTEDGLNISGAIKFQNASASVDIYPFRGSFRISPGFTYKNNNSLNATLLVPGGQKFSLGDNDFYSDPSDPVHGSAAFNFGNNLAPRLTMGFGNMLPRNGGHFSFPVEVGFQYIAQPTVRLTASGTACTNALQVGGTTVSGCGPVDQGDVQQEQHDLQNDLSPLRFYPVLSIGVSYRIGRSRSY